MAMGIEKQTSSRGYGSRQKEIVGCKGGSHKLLPRVNEAEVVLVPSEVEAGDWKVSPKTLENTII